MTRKEFDSTIAKILKDVPYCVNAKYVHWEIDDEDVQHCVFDEKCESCNSCVDKSKYRFCTQDTPAYLCLSFPLIKKHNNEEEKFMLHNIFPLEKHNEFPLVLIRLSDKAGNKNDICEAKEIEIIYNIMELYKHIKD